MATPKYDVLMKQLHATFNEMVAELARERDAQQRQIRTAWGEIERERTALQQARRQMDAAATTAGTRLPSASLTASSIASRPSSRDGTSLGARPAFASSPKRGGAYDDRDDSRRSTFTQDVDAVPSAVRGPQWITVWPGYSRGGQPKRLLVHPDFTFPQLAERAAQETNSRPAPRVLYTPDGRTVSTLEELRPGTDYLVLPGGSRYSENNVPTLLLEKLVGSVVPLTFGGH